MEHAGFLLIIVMCFLPTATCIQYECPPFNGTLLGSMDTPSQDGLISSAFDSNTLIQVFEFKIVCLAAGITRDHYQFVTVAVTYSCQGLSCNGIQSSLFDCRCSYGMSGLEWTNYRIGQNPEDLPTADFPTSRMNCSACVPPSEHLLVDYDPITHCAACSEECSGSSLGLCTGILPTECCDFYNGNTCVAKCPTDSVPDSDFNCISLSNICSFQLSSPINGNVSIFPESTSGPIAVYNCDDGYVLVGSSLRTCKPQGWSGDEPICEVISVPSEGSSFTPLDVSLVVISVVLVILSCICTGSIVVLGTLYSREKKKHPQHVYELASSIPTVRTDLETSNSSDSRLITSTETDQNCGYITPDGGDLGPNVSTLPPQQPGHVLYDNLETSGAVGLGTELNLTQDTNTQHQHEYVNWRPPSHYQSLLVSTQDYTTLYSSPKLNQGTLIVERQGHDYHVVDPSKTNPAALYDLAH